MFDWTDCHSCLLPPQDGWNLAAVKAVVLGVLPSLPGFLATVGLVKDVPPIASRLYQFAWFVGFGTALLSYCSFMPKALSQ